jgi:glycosyltransferase involved in cell wall biosynthesis
MAFEEYLKDIPLLHSWDGGITWNTGGFEASSLQKLYSLASKQPKPVIIETGAGNSTIAFLYANPGKLISITPEQGLIARIREYCQKQNLNTEKFVPYLDISEIRLPKLLEENIRADLVLIDGGHGWPTVFVDFCYLNAMLKDQGLLILDDVELYSVAELRNLILGDPGFELTADLGKTLVFKKTTSEKFLPEWNKQNYIVNRTNEMSDAKKEPTHNIFKKFFRIFGAEDNQQKNKTTNAKSTVSAIANTTRHLFVEFTPLHEGLFDVYSRIRASELLKIPTEDWWISGDKFEIISRSISHPISSLTFLTLDRVLYSPATNVFEDFARGIGVPISGILHRLPENRSDMTALKVTRGLIKNVFILAEELRNEVQELFGSDANIIHISHHAIEEDLLDHFSASPQTVQGAQPGDYVISLLGEARKGKGIDLLLESLEYIPEDVRRHIYFVFAGKGRDWTREHVERELDRNGCRGLVDLRSTSDLREYSLVSKEEFARYVLGSDLGMLLYQGEQRRCASGVLPNYVRAQRRVLATADSVTGEIVANNNLGSVLHKETAPALADAIKQCFHSNKLWSPDAKYIKYRENISSHNVISKFSRILESL